VDYHISGLVEFDMVYYEQNAASFGLKIGHPDFKIVHQQTTEFQGILIAETQKYGRALFLDGVIQSTEADEGIYHDMLVHPVMAHVKAARKILVAGAGEGASLRELLKHSSVEHIDAVEIDGGMIRAAKEHLPSWHKGAFADDRVTVLEADIFDHLETTGSDAYDGIIVDLTDPIDADGEFCADSLIFNKDFLKLLQTALKPGGCMVVQAGERLSALGQVLPLLKRQFSWVQPYSVFVPSFYGNWTFLLLADEDKSSPQRGIEAALTAQESLSCGYFSRLAYLHAAEQADRFFTAAE